MKSTFSLYYYCKHHQVVLIIDVDLVHSFTWLPWSLENGEMEFRILHLIFCEQYNIRCDDFAFDEYVERIFEKYLLETITIQPMDWFIVLVFVMVNWSRNALEINVNCNHTDDCSDWVAIELFTISGQSIHVKNISLSNELSVIGAVTLIITVTLAVISRIYELRLLRYRKVMTGADYIQFLQAEKEAEKWDLRHRYSGKELRVRLTYWLY